MAKLKVKKLIEYFSLLTVLLVGISLVLPLRVQALSLTGNGQANITSTVNGAAPSVAPTIDSPAQGQNVDQKNITIEGTCVTGLIVKIFSNNVFVGSAVCQNGGYALQIDLFIGKNDLVARQYDGLNQSSPDSQITTVYYIAPSIQPSLSSSQQASGENIEANFTLILKYDSTVAGVFPGQPFRLPITFNGGVAPYAVGVDWGNSSNDLFSRDNDETFFAEHTYKNPGLYTIKVKVIDKFGETAFNQFVVVVKGQTSTNPINKILNRELVPDYIYNTTIPLIALGCFWGGRRYQHRKHKKTCEYCE